MHESKQKQANSKSQVYSQARDEQEAEESFLQPEDSLVQQVSGSGNLPNARFQAQMLSRIPASQIASKPELLLQMQQQFGNSHVSQVVQMARARGGLGRKEGLLAPSEHQEKKTGLPDNLKAGIENLSGYSMDDVKVHYNSTKPAQLPALAYTQGTNIYVAPGQEKYLAHEAWHVVQQKQGRVKGTKRQPREEEVNEERGLETEAEDWGKRAAEAGKKSRRVKTKKEKGREGSRVGQREREVPRMAKKPIQKKFKGKICNTLRDAKKEIQDIEGKNWVDETAMDDDKKPVLEGLLRDPDSDYDTWKDLQAAVEDQFTSEVTMAEEGGAKDQPMGEGALNVKGAGPVAGTGGATSEFEAGQGNNWHIHKDHIKYGNDNSTRVNFDKNNSKANDIIDKARNSGSSRASGPDWNACVNWLRQHLK